MSGTSNGMVLAHMTGVRVANHPYKPNQQLMAGEKRVSPMIYTPAHTKPDGSFVSARLQFRVLCNKYGGDPNNPDGYRIVAWGGRADMFAKALAKGKELNLICEGNSFRAQVYNNEGQPVNNRDGTPLTVDQLSWAITDFTFGGDSEQTVLEEIKAGIRPDGWNVPNSPGNLAWKQIVQQKKAEFYQGGEVYGYARVMPPKTPGCQILLGDQSARARREGQTGVQATPALTQQIQQALPSQPQVATQPIAQPVQTSVLPPVQGIPAQSAPMTTQNVV